MISPNSPWAVSADELSPDGRYRARILEANEVGMGAPTAGTLIVEDLGLKKVVRELDSCSPAFVWSADSTALAVPRWTPDRDQRLVILFVPDGGTLVRVESYRVLQLESFEDGVVRGVDSPIHAPRRIEIAAGRPGEAAAGVACCDQLPVEIMNRTVLDVESLRDHCEPVRVPDLVDSRYYRCTKCGQLWMDRPRAVPLGDIHDAVKVWSAPRV